MKNLILQKGTTWDGKEVHSLFSGNHPIIANMDRHTAFSVYLAMKKAGEK